MSRNKDHGARRLSDARMLAELVRMRKNGECDDATSSILAVAFAERIADRRCTTLDPNVPEIEFENACNRMLIDVFREYGETELADDFESDPGFFRLRHEIAGERFLAGK